MAPPHRPSSKPRPSLPRRGGGGGGCRGLPGTPLSAFLRCPDSDPAAAEEGWWERPRAQVQEEVGSLGGFADIGEGLDLASEGDGEPLKGLGPGRRAAGRPSMVGAEKVTLGAEGSKGYGR